MKIEHLFFELIRVALGTQDTLSRPPSKAEWAELYAMSQKQSLVGICFSAVQKLTHNQEPRTQNLDEVQYLTWMGMAAQIQQRNEVLNRQCVELQKRLSADELRASILKGQGVGQLYAEHLRGLRQSGDIDVFVAGGMAKAFEYCRQKYGKFEWDYINAHIPVYEDTEVELHWRVHSHTNLFKNKRLQSWLVEHEDDALGGMVVLSNGENIVVPSAEFNAFYILLHCYHHMFESGLGLRQLMDWYFVLKSRNNTSTDSAQSSNLKTNINLVALFAQFGMKKFAEGVLWLIWHVFEGECPDSFLVTPNSSFLTPNSKEGRFLLKEVMQNGNFGHHDERKIRVKSRMVQPFVTRIQHNWHLATHYPSEFFWAPVWLVYHYIWKRTRKQYKQLNK